MLQIADFFLTVQSAGNGRFRFYLNTKFSSRLQVVRGTKLFIQLTHGAEFLIVKASCGRPIQPDPSKKYKTGYDLFHSKINLWILDKSRVEKIKKYKFEVNEFQGSYLLTYKGL